MRIAMELALNKRRLEDYHEARAVYANHVSERHMKSIDSIHKEQIRAIQHLRDVREKNQMRKIERLRS